MIRHRYVLLSLLLFCANAWAGPREDLHAAFGKFLALTSFKASINSTMNGKATLSTVEFQAPDRFRITPPGRPPSLVIGDVMYLTVGTHAIKVPGVGKTVTQYRDPGIVKQFEQELDCEDLGLDTLAGEATHKYRYRSGQAASDTVAWISVRSGLVVQLQTSGKVMGKTVDTQVNYSGFNDPAIRIVAPD